MLLEIAALLALLVINGVFAMAEIAMVSARRTRLQHRAEQGDRRAAVALELASRPNRFLATIQIGITLVGVLAGAFGGATIGADLGRELDEVGWIAPYGRPLGVGLVVVATTYLALVIGELVPKRLALNRPERLACAVAVPMRTLSRVAAPLVGLLSVSTDLVVRLLGVSPSREPSVTEEDVRRLIEQGRRTGIFEDAERDMIERILRMDDRTVAAVMTPRHEIVALDVEATEEATRQRIAEATHSRFPVIEGDPYDVLGIVDAKQLLADAARGHPLQLRSVLRPASFVPESATLLQALELFRRERSHLALVTDEYGDIEGLVTAQDILEAIVGELPESPGEPEAVQREDGSWLLDGMLDIDRARELLEMEELPDGERSAYNTVAGLVVQRTGDIPSTGDHFVWGDLRFEVVDMDERRVDKVLVTRRPDGEGGDGAKA